MTTKEDSGLPLRYSSVDQLQNLLATDVFHYTKDAKKAAGRALGTLVEIITFYLLKSWGFERSITIESSLPEYGNPEIKHNVEFSLHPVIREYSLSMDKRLPVSAARILREIDETKFPLTDFETCSRILLATSGTLRNACVIANGTETRSRIVATLNALRDDDLQLTLVEQLSGPYALFECKRVGVEEGMKKGPQTIEKAKQGAYVAKALSALHKLRTASGNTVGLIYRGDRPYSKPYLELVAEVIDSDDADLLRDFVLTVGVVSNHGNWFTSEHHNKELKVLAQSYDWLLFLTDKGLVEFITELLLRPEPLLEPARQAFLASYTGTKKQTQFTKVQMNYDADKVLRTYFSDNRRRIEGWFNVITPREATAERLRRELAQLREKNWMEIHAP